MKNKILFIVFALVLFPFTAKADDLLYSPTTPTYLAKSYWLLNSLDTESKENLDQYLMVTECDLYNQYYTNDIEWSKIREATKKYIIANKQGFPTRFEFVQPIFLDRYDEATGKFALMKNSQMIGIKQLQISGNYLQSFPCLDNTKYRPDIFPLNAIVTLSRPLNYINVNASPTVVAEYIKYLDEHKTPAQNGRPAYVRYRIKVEQSLKPTPYKSDYFANFFGSLESMTIFGDRDLFIKLEEVKF